MTAITRFIARHLAQPFVRTRSERGEGVISLAIGVLIIAFLGAGMWLAFHSTMQTTQTKVDQQIQSIGG